MLLDNLDEMIAQTLVSARNTLVTFTKRFHGLYRDLNGTLSLLYITQEGCEEQNRTVQTVVNSVFDMHVCLRYTPIYAALMLSSKQNVDFKS